MHVCSRDGPERVAVLLADLGVVVEGLDTAVVVYDDSTTAEHRASYRTVCHAAGASYFGDDDRRALVAEAGRSPGLESDLLATGRPFGTGRWDLAGCRFTAMLHGAMHPDPSTLHLFLDDDLRLVDCEYAGQAHAVDTVAVRRLLAQPELVADRLGATGPGFRGRADMSLLEHLDASLDGRGGGDDDIAACLSSGVCDHPDSPGISGGFLLTNRVSLRMVPLSRSYNEDWIWLRQLRMAGGVVHRVGASVVHAGAPTVRLSLPALLHQFEGEVLDTAVRLSEEAGVPFEACSEKVHEAFELCKGRLEATEARAGGMRLLGDLRVAIDAQPPGRYSDLLRCQAERSRRWARAFGSAMMSA